MDKAFLLGSLFLRLSSIYAGATHGDLLNQRKARKRKKEDHEDQMEKAPWKVELLAKASRETSSQKAA